MKRYLAPLIKTISGKQLAAEVRVPSGAVKNPDYERWARFDPGSWVLMEGRQTIDGEVQPLRMKITLVSKNPGQLVFRREQLDVDGRPGTVPFPQTIYASAHIARGEHPMTHPASQITNRPNEKVRVGSREFVCKVTAISVPAEFRDWGDHPQATVYTCDEVPCGIVQVDIKTKFGQTSVAMTGKVVDFHVAAR